MSLLRWLKGAAGAGVPTEVSTDNPLPLGLQSAAIVVPTDKQAILRWQAFLTTAQLASGATYTSPTLDGIQVRRITILLQDADQATTVAIQQSDNGTNWRQTLSVAPAAGNGTAQEQVLFARYVRVLITNDGALATTNLRFAGFLSVE